jgi:hypothetical protein
MEDAARRGEAAVLELMPGAERFAGKARETNRVKVALSYWGVA